MQTDECYGCCFKSSGVYQSYGLWGETVRREAKDTAAIITGAIFKLYKLLCFPSSVQQPDPNQPKAEGAQMEALQGEQLGVVTNWPPSLEAALQRWGTISPKAPCLTTMDTNGKPLYLLTYGKRGDYIFYIYTCVNDWRSSGGDWNCSGES